MSRPFTLTAEQYKQMWQPGAAAPTAAAPPPYRPPSEVSSVLSGSSLLSGSSMRSCEPKAHPRASEDTRTQLSLYTDVSSRVSSASKAAAKIAKLQKQLMAEQEKRKKLEAAIEMVPE